MDAQAVATYFRHDSHDIACVSPIKTPPNTGCHSLMVLRGVFHTFSWSDKNAGTGRKWDLTSRLVGMQRARKGNQPVFGGGGHSHFEKHPKNGVLLRLG